MVQFSTLFSTLSKNKSRRVDVIGRHLAKEAKRNQLLLTSSGIITSRNCDNFAAAHSKRGKKGFNQDCFLVWQEFGCQEDTVLCGVFDGHGPWGHLVSKTVRELLPSSLISNQQDIFKTYAAVDREIQDHPGIESYYSGTTALVLIRQGDVLTVANVGDCRAVLATVSDDETMVAIQLTVDQKPNLPSERSRIAQSRGRVYCCPDEPGLHRIWMPKGETVEGPGLAVSRAFGDYYIKDFGLISEPEITETRINGRDQFVILATDGVWDVISNEEAVGIVMSCAQERAESAKRLVEKAVCGWKQRGKAAVMDDISVVCLFFHQID